MTLGLHTRLFSRYLCLCQGRYLLHTEHLNFHRAHLGQRGQGAIVPTDFHLVRELKHSLRHWGSASSRLNIFSRCIVESMHQALLWALLLAFILKLGLYRQPFQPLQLLCEIRMNFYHARSEGLLVSLNSLDTPDSQKSLLHYESPEKGLKCQLSV